MREEEEEDGQANSSTQPLLSEPQSRPRISTKPSLRQRQSSTFAYHTFPTAPPRNPGNKASKDGMPQQPQQQQPQNSSDSPPPPYSPSHRRRSSSHSEHHETPLPKKQLAILAVIALAEQTALNSISPYLPEMASTFPEVQPGQVGLYVGLIASSFALAQFATNFMWGWLSDRIGRKPIVMCGTLLTAVCFVAFGFCRTLWQAVLVQALMGLVNGNQGVISTCLGEITDRSNQSRAFTYLPVIYGLGGITGPIVGGLLVMKKNPFKSGKPNPYPYLFPNLLSAAVLIIDLILTAFFLEESLEKARDLPPLGKRVGNMFTWLWQFSSPSRRPTYTRRQSSKRSQPKPSSDNAQTSSSSSTESSHLLPRTSGLQRSEIFNRDTLLLLATFLIFQLANISFNSLYPIFAQADPPVGRDLSPEEIGISLAFAGLITIVFQIGVFGRLREKVGNKATYRAGLAGFVVAFLLMPLVGYKDGSHLGHHPHGKATTAGRIWLWVELGAILIIKTVAAVGGLTSALLLITNSAPSHAVLGTLNGLAQTLSAAGRAVGPFISGGLFTAATKMGGQGGWLAFGVFGGVAFLGFGLSFGIRGEGLEAEGWDEESEGDEEEGSGSGSGSGSSSGEEER